MKRICITYHMSIDRSKPSDDYPHNIETVETCIDLTMLDEIADDILENQSHSKWVNSFGFTGVDDVLQKLAELQGYQEAHFCCADAE